MEEPEKLRRAVIKEELVEITGDFVKAVILNQFIYWAERVKDFDEYRKQENEIRLKHGEEPQELSAGWIYKTADDMAKETMLNFSKSNIRAHIKALVEMGYIQERRNPKYKWDKTLQYRVSLSNIETALNKRGYHLEGYTFTQPRSAETNLCSSETNLCSSKTEPPREQNRTAIPKTTTKITSKTTNINNIKSSDVLQNTTADKKSNKPKSTIFEEYAEGNDELLSTLKDFESMRKAIKSPLTERAKKLILTELNKLSTDKTVQIAILNQSILNNWKGVFPLKSNNAISRQQETKKAYNYEYGKEGVDFL